MACYVIETGRSLELIVSDHFYCLTFHYATEYEGGGLLSASGVWIHYFRLARNHGLESQDHRETSSAHGFPILELNTRFSVKRLQIKLNIV